MYQQQKSMQHVLYNPANSEKNEKFLIKKHFEITVTMLLKMELKLSS